MSSAAERTVITQGRHLLFVKRGGWEYVERTKVSGIVALVAVTPLNRLILVEQFRPPIQARCIELPAGLAGDIPGQENEALSESARRELLEETGYAAESLELLADGAASAGLCNEIITLFRARGLKKIEAGGGDSSENIQIHEIPLAEVPSWIADRRKEGVQVDLKVYAGLYFAHL